MKRIGLLVVIAAIVLSFAVTAFAACGCNKCAPCPKPCQPCVTCGEPCNALQSMYNWMSGWCMPCAPCAQPCNTCPKPACNSCSK